MKHQILFLFFVFLTSLFSQNLQLHYDFRHSLDPEHNKRNFTTLSFETFKSADYGSIFMKMDVDFKGNDNNISNLYTQISQTLKFWDFPAFMHLQYSGGLGFIDKSLSGYYINNAYLIGVAYPFQWGKDWCSMYLAYRYNNFDKPSHDIEYSLYWRKNILGEKISLTGHMVIWTENRNHGDAWAENLSGKKILFLSESLIWYNFNPLLAIGSEIKMFYHVYSYSEHLLIYPTAATKYNF